MAVDALGPEQEIHRAEEAGFLLNNPLLARTLDDMEAATIQKWEMENNKDVREDYWRLYKVIKLFRQALTTYIETGKMAKMTLAQERNRRSI